MSPIIVQHPIFESGITYADGEMVNLLESEGHKKAMKKWSEKIAEIDSLTKCTLMVRSSYYLTFFKFIKNYLSLKDFSMLLGKFWTEEETPNDDTNVSVNLAAKWFKQADKQTLMYKMNEYDVYAKLTESFTVYRGVTPGRD